MSAPSYQRTPPKPLNDLADELDTVPSFDELRTDLRQLRGDIRCGRFTRDDLITRAERLESNLHLLRDGATVAGDLIVLKALCTISEVYDYHGCYDRAQKVISEDAESILAEAKQWNVPVPEDIRGLRKQQISLLLCYAQGFYRRLQYQDAFRLAKMCDQWVENLFRKAGDPARVTSARVHFFLGSVNRQLSEYEESRRAYTQALECVSENARAGDRDKQGGRPIQLGRLEEDQAAIRRTVALCFAPRGLGWLAYVRGHLQEALTYITAARAWLYTTDDWVNKAYTDLLLGMVHRAMAGYNVEKLREAQKIIEEPYDTFRRHPIYKARAAFELALVHLYLGEMDVAEKCVDEVLGITGQTHDERWECKALIVRSRIMRHGRDYKKAAEDAAKALGKAKEIHHLLCEVDARIALAEAHIELRDLDDGQQELSIALTRAKDNIATRAVCHLHLVRIFLLQNKLRLADKHWAYWLKVGDRVENGFVRALADRVRAEREKRISDFVIPWTEGNLNYEQHVGRLREFLLREARRRHDNNEKIAEDLGISRQTLYNWSTKE